MLLLHRISKSKKSQKSRKPGIGRHAGTAAAESQLHRRPQAALALRRRPWCQDFSDICFATFLIFLSTCGGGRGPGGNLLGDNSGTGSGSHSGSHTQLCFANEMYEQD